MGEEFFGEILTEACFFGSFFEADNFAICDFLANAALLIVTLPFLI